MVVMLLRVLRLLLRWKGETPLFRSLTNYFMLLFMSNLATSRGRHQGQEILGCIGTPTPRKLKWLKHLVINTHSRQTECEYPIGCLFDTQSRVKHQRESKRMTKYITIFIFTSLLAGAETYSATFSARLSKWIVGFPGRVNGDAYVSYINSIEIISVFADGKQISPVKTESTFRNPSDTLGRKTNNICYSIDLKNLMGLGRVDGEFDYSHIYIYQIPNNAEVVNIAYRIYSPDGTFDENELDAFEMNALLGL